MSLFKVNTKMNINFVYIVDADNEHDAREYIEADLASGSELDQWADKEVIDTVTTITKDEFGDLCNSAVNGHMRERIIHNANVFTSLVVDVLDNGDAVIELPPLLIKRMGWGEGTRLDISEENGQIIVKQVAK